MASNARRGFWFYSHKPLDLTDQILPMLGESKIHADNEVESLE
jgi:hypothetical protein